MAEFVDINMLDYNLMGGKSLIDERGRLAGQVFTHKSDNSLLVEPESGGGWRGGAEMAVAVAQANPDKPVYFNFSQYNLKMTPSDNVTGVFIQLKDAFKSALTLKVTGETGGLLQAVPVPRDQYSNIDLFEALADGVRISRQNGGKPVTFAFNNYSMAVRDGDDAEALESGVPRTDRTIVTRTPVPRSPLPPLPTQKVGKFTLRG